MTSSESDNELTRSLESAVKATKWSRIFVIGTGVLWILLATSVAFYFAMTAKNLKETTNDLQLKTRNISVEIDNDREQAQAKLQATEARSKTQLEETERQFRDQAAELQKKITTLSNDVLNSSKVTNEATAALTKKFESFGIKPGDIEQLQAAVEILKKVTSKDNLLAGLRSEIETKVAESQKLALEQLPPVGTIVAFGGKNAVWDNEWQLCDGHSVKAEEYPLLEKYVGELWGKGEAKGDIKLPDLTGLFLRGVDSGGASDKDSKDRKPLGNGRYDDPGSRQEDALKDHTHSISVTGAVAGLGTGPTLLSTTNLKYAKVDSQTGAVSNESDGKTHVAKETRPVNASVIWIIRVGPKQVKKEKDGPPTSRPAPR